MERDDISGKPADGKGSSYLTTLHRLSERLGDRGLEGWNQVQKEVDRAVEFELDAENLTRDEAQLLRAWLKRDLRDLADFLRETGKDLADWLRFDVALLEDSVQTMMERLADPARVEQSAMLRAPDADSPRSEVSEEIWASGEFVLPGRFRCTNCGTSTELRRPAQLPVCPQCAGEVFLRS